MAFSLPQIILTQWVSEPPSPEGECEEAEEVTSLQCNNQSNIRETRMRGSPYIASVETRTEIKRNSEGLELLQSSAEIWTEKENDTCMQLLSGFQVEAPPTSKHTETLPFQQEGISSQGHCYIAQGETTGFLITNARTQPLSMDEVISQLVKEREGEVLALNAGVGEEDSRDTSAHRLVVCLDNKPLILKEEATDLKAVGRKFPSAGDESKGSNAAVGFCSDVTEPSARGASSNSGRTPPPSKDPSRLCKEAQREDLVGFPIPKYPVPKPRSFHGRGPTHQVTKQCKAPLLKDQLTNLPRTTEYRITLGQRILDAPTDGEGAKADSNTGGEPAEREYTLALEDKAKEETPLVHSMTLRSNKICEGTYQRLDSLEETIRELEMTINEISGHSSAEFIFSKELLGQMGSGDSSKGTRKDPGGVSQNYQSDKMVEPTPLDLGWDKEDAPKALSPSRTKPPLLPKPQLPLHGPQVYFLLFLLLCSAFRFHLMPSLPPPPLLLFL